MKRPEWIAPKNQGAGNEIYYFKKTVKCRKIGKAQIKISAQSRYKLYINGIFCGFGPCKGTREKLFVDTVDVTEYIKIGENEILVEVLKLTAPACDGRWGCVEGVIRKGMACLCCSFTAPEAGIRTNITWRVAKKDGMELKSLNSANFNETVSYPECEQLMFKPPVSLGEADDDTTDHYWWGITSEFFLSERPIPNLEMTEIPVSFDGRYYDAGYLTFGYPTFKISGNGTAHINYFECFGSQDPKIKADRCDRSLGYGVDNSDTVISDGKEYMFTPFWFRTFRFIDIQTEGEVSVKLEKFVEVNYPMHVRDDYDFGRDDDNKLFEISVRTLKRCMHETYEDCPYYEQLQYAMDTSLQMIYNYQLTDDDRLARKAMDDFAAAQLSNGLMPSRYPSISDQHIPTFQLYFILMVYSHYIRFGDISLVRKHLRAIDGIVEWFTPLVENGIVTQSKYWNFIDWAEPWTYDKERKCDGGVPLGYKEGPIGIYSSMLAYFLTLAAKLNDAVGRGDVAGEYERLAYKLKRGTEKKFYDDETGMYADDFAHTKYSQHMQTWCVLSGIAKGERAKQIMINSGNVAAKSTYAFAYMYFRALEVAGLYNMSEKLMNSYRGLLRLNCTTVPETPKDSRSECHAWGAIAIYEFSATVLGVRTYGTKDKSVSIKPYTEGRDHACGTVSSIAGDVYVSWKKENGKFEITVKNDSDSPKVITMPNGKVYITTEKETTCTCNL